MKNSVRKRKAPCRRSPKRVRLGETVISAVLALTLVIGTTGVQLHPVLAADANRSVPVCGKEEHTHNDKCYTEDENLVCVKEEHKHNESCYKDEETSETGAAVEGQTTETEQTEKKDETSLPNVNKVEEKTKMAAKAKSIEASVKETDAAVVGDKGYPSLQAAVDAAQAGDEIKLLKDITESVQIVSNTKAKELRIDVNGHTWTGDNASALTVNTGSRDITLMDGSGKRAGVMKAAAGYRVITSVAPGNKIEGINLKVRNLTLNGNEAGVKSESKNNTFGGILSVDGGAGSSDCFANVTFESCTLENGVAGSGGAVAVRYGSATITGCTFKSNTASSYGGGVYIQGGASIAGRLDITDTNFERNQAQGSSYGGGAVYADSTVLQVNAGTFRENTGKVGGAIFLKGKLGRLSINDGAADSRAIFTGNTALLSGGAINISDSTQGGDVVIRNADFIQNKCTTGKGMAYGGGALYFGGDMSAASKNLVLTGITAKSNETQTGSGGAIWVRTTGTLEMSDSIITGNTAAPEKGDATYTKQNGGGLMAYQVKTASIENCRIEDNLTGDSGGGAYIKMTANGGAELKGTTVTRNQANGNVAASGGGGLYLTSSSKTTQNTEYTLDTTTHVYNNQAPQDAHKEEVGGASSEVLIQYPLKVTTLKGFDNQTVADGKTYAMKCSTKYKTVSKYYSKVTLPKQVYLAPNGPGSEDYGENIVTATLKEAVESAKEQKTDKIYVCDKVSITADDQTCINGTGITFIRAEKNTNAVFEVSRGENVTFSDVKIKDTAEKAQKALVVVGNSSTLNIKDSALIEGGVNSTGEGGGIYVSQNARLNMSGGLVRSNQAAANGAGLYLTSGSAFTMSGGSITGNTSSKSGGGIYAIGADLTITGGEISGNIAKGGDGGGGMFVRAGTLKITKGKGARASVSNNTSSLQGGGIHLTFGAAATIDCADINGNKSLESGNFAGGGGIYVHSGSTLNMKNVYIYKNELLGSGEQGNSYKVGAGALYSCPTGRMAIFKSEGALIAKNQKFNRIGDAVSCDIQYWRTSNNTVAYVSDYILGGADANWSKKADAKPPYEYLNLYGVKESFHVYSHAAEEGIDTARAIAERDGVVMTGNQAYSYGLAIANNGNLIIGTEDMALTVRKTWEGGDEDQIPEEILVYLQKTLGGKTTNVTPEERAKDATVRLNRENQWSYTWENLGDSEAVDWSVAEAGIKGYKVDISQKTLDTSWQGGVKKHYIIDIKNEAADTDLRDLTISKQVITNGNNQSTDGTFKFRLNLEFENAEHGGKAYAAYKTDAGNKKGPLQPVYDVQNIEFELQHGESFTIQGLPSGTKYTVTEENSKMYVVQAGDQVTADGTTRGTIPSNSGESEGHEQDVVVEYKNTPKSSITASLTVEKKWEDNDNAANVRPNKITVNLMQDGKPFDSKELTSQNGWKYTWNSLPKFDPEDWHEYTWKVTEDAVENYKTVVSGGDPAVFDEENRATVTVTNTVDVYEVKLIKHLKRYNATGGEANFVYRVTVEDREGVVIYSNVLQMDFTEAGDQEVSLGEFPAGTRVIVEEVYSGNGYELTEGDRRQEITVTGPGGAAEYTNDCNGQTRPGTAIVNRFEKTEGGGWKWAGSEAEDRQSE